MTGQKLLYEDFTKKIIGHFYRLHGQLKTRPGYSEPEKAYALANAIKSSGMSACLEVPISHKHAGERIGKGIIDIVVECRVAVIVRNAPSLTQHDIDILDRYLEDSGLPVGLLLNFGTPEIDSKRDIKRRECIKNFPSRRTT